MLGTYVNTYFTLGIMLCLLSSLKFDVYVISEASNLANQRGLGPEAVRE